jgi:hypothetical protein
MRRKRLKKRENLFYECVLEFNYATIPGFALKIVVPYWACLDEIHAASGPQHIPIHAVHHLDIYTVHVFTSHVFRIKVLNYIILCSTELSPSVNRSYASIFETLERSAFKDLCSEVFFFMRSAFPDSALDKGLIDKG